MKKISNILFYIGLGLSIYGYYRSYVNRANLPSGVCPIESNNNIFIAAIIMMITSLILSFVEDYKKKNNKT